MFDDQHVVHAQVRANFDKVKDVLHIVEFSLQELSKSFSGLSTYGVLIKCVDSDKKKDQVTRVLNL
jgi:hypothetical protein